ncbi:hydroxyethylthiazole kinase [Agrobacterium larrymoorei]|uniref:hydroxyethylthiazole kinase n=1 Tax=Agrobacterium larrymoorei TaxID=160699 RepID=UPI0015743ACE|nr:hydroxyethylthiazole kinase [Agrobacterium larrymoorei]NTJ44490.1 hydroxyethylthiazole kinase [Agrobacterium larrymoorei]
MSSFPTAHNAAEILARVRERRPRVHCLMNTVVQKFTADGITAVGGIPSMTSSEEEIESFVAKTDALTINLGTLDATRRNVIRIAVEIANREGKPWIVDPVHCDYSPSRLEFAYELSQLRPSILRGNDAEMAVINDTGAALRIQTGPVDRLKDDTRKVRIVNGHSLMAKVTGTGCLSGGVIAAFMAVEPDPMLAAAAALSVTGVSAEIAARHAKGPGTFEAAFLDALFNINGSDVISHARIEHDED